MVRRGVAALIVALLAGGAWAQEEEDDGLGAAAPAEARAVVARGLEAMGGLAEVEALKAAALRIEAGEGAVQERHTLRLAGRFLHYASRQPNRTGFDVVLAGPVAFLCDRDPEGKATYVEDLAPQDAREGAYERDVLFMPLLLAALVKDAKAGLEHKGRTSAGEDVVKATVLPAEGAAGEPFVLRLKFDPQSKRLAGVMGVIPCGADAGKKRYLGFLEWRQLEGKKLWLPHRISDARDRTGPGGAGARAESAREYAVAWELDPALDAALFERPKLEKERR